MESTESTALKQKRGARPLKEVADLFGVTSSAYHKWENGRVPAERCAEVSQKLGILLHVLRPDVFPAPKKGRAA